MDFEHRALLMKTWKLIEVTRDEISQLRHEIELTRDTVERSEKLLSRTEPTKQRIAKPAKAL